jgi:hypothetical protein
MERILPDLRAIGYLLNFQGFKYGFYARYFNTKYNDYKVCWLSQGYYQSLGAIGAVTFSSYPEGLASIETILKSLKIQ